MYQMIGKLPMLYIRKVNAQIHQTTDQSHLFASFVNCLKHITASHIMQHLEDNAILSRFTIVSHEAKKKQAIRNE